MSVDIFGCNKKRGEYPCIQWVEPRALQSSCSEPLHKASLSPVAKNIKAEKLQCWDCREPWEGEMEAQTGTGKKVRHRSLSEKSVGGKSSWKWIGGPERPYLFELEPMKCEWACKKCVAAMVSWLEHLGVCCVCSKVVSSFFRELHAQWESCRSLKERPALACSFERSRRVRSIDAAPAAFATVGDRTPGWGWLKNQKREGEEADPAIPFALPIT